jgi:hypothetical protein
LDEFFTILTAKSGSPAAGGSFRKDKSGQKAMNLKIDGFVDANRFKSGGIRAQRHLASQADD